MLWMLGATATEPGGRYPGTKMAVGLTSTPCHTCGVDVLMSRWLILCCVTNKVHDTSMHM